MKKVLDIQFGEKFDKDGRNYIRVNPHTDLPGRVAMRMNCRKCIAKDIRNGQLVEFSLEEKLYK